MRFNPRDLDKRVRIERPVAAEGIRGAGSGTWAPVDSVWAKIEDVRPGRGEQDGVTTKRARVWMRYREDVTSDMRLVYGTRVLNLISDPVELGRRDRIEMLAEEHRPAGNGA